MNIAACRSWPRGSVAVSVSDGDGEELGGKEQRHALGP